MFSSRPLDILARLYIVPMSDERQEEDINDPLDDEFDAAMDAATQLAVHAHRIGMQQLELPVGEDGNVWVVNIRKLGVRDS